MRKVFYFFSLIFLASCINAGAQNPYIRHFTTVEGLPTNTIYQIYQDSHKFIWFTSDAGVVKFDGSKFTTYRKKDGLSSNDVVRIKEDYKGRIWLFGYNGTVSFIKDDKVYNNKNAPFLSSLIGNGFILDFITDSNKTITFYNFQKGVYSLDVNNNLTQDQLFKNVDYEHPISKNTIIYFRILNISQSISNGLVIWSKQGVFFQQSLQSKVSLIDTSLKCDAVFPVANNTFYVRTTSCELIKVTNNFQKKKIPFLGDVKKIKTIIEDSEGYLWIAAYDEGVFCMKDNKVIRHFNIKDALGLIQDHESNIWVSTQSEGIFEISHNILEQNHFDCNYFNNIGVNRLYDFPGVGIWCTNTKTAFLLKNKVLYTLSEIDDIQPINLLYQFKNKTLLLGSTGLRFYTFENIQCNSITRKISYSDRKIHDFATKKIIIDKSGNIAVLYNQERIYFTSSINPLLNAKFSQIKERVNYAYFNEENELVINAQKNNYLFKNEKLEPYNELSRFDGTIISDHLFLTDSVELFNIDGDRIYVLKNHNFYDLTQEFDAPIDIQIKKIIYSGATLYIATLKNIFICYNPLQQFPDAPIHIEPLNIRFNNINDFLIHNDTLYIASDDGLTVIAESSILKTKENPPIPYLNSITVNDKEYILKDSKLVLTGKNAIHLSFGFINYSSSPVIYSYKLEGSENNWTNGTGTDINLIYQNLHKGHYVFKLRVRKANSNWSKPLELEITIKPTLIEYPVFWVFICLILAGIVSIIIYRIRIEKMKQVEVDHQLIVMEQKALQSMMNPHFIFNSLGSIQNFLLNNKGSEAVIYLSQFAKLIRQNLNSINTPMILLEDEIDRLKNYMNLEKIRLENKFDFSIDIDYKFIEEGVFIPSMIIQPIVENSIWHGIATLECQGIIQISFREYNEKSLKVIVEDNGIGIKKALEYSAKSSQHNHLGMQIIEKRLGLLSKKYSTETSLVYTKCTIGNNNPGTRVELIMPIIYNKEDF